MEGCPGHKLKIHYHHTSDTVSVLLDGSVFSTYDDVMWNRLRTLNEAYRDRDTRRGLSAVELEQTLRELRAELLSDGYHRPNWMILKIDAALGEEQA